MPVTWQTATGLVNAMVVAAQATFNRTGQILDTSVGSVTLALAEGCKAMALWLQRQNIEILAITRASTSSGADLDSWLAQFSYGRLPASNAVGVVTLARATPTQAAIVPVGNLVSTGAGGQQFQITADPANIAYSATAVPPFGATPASPGYVLGVGVVSIDVPVVAVVAGSIGNVQANTIQSFVQGVVGIDSVTNVAQMENGLDSQTDEAARIGFSAYIQTRARATAAAIAYAVSSVSQGLSYTIHVSVDEAGAVRRGHFVIYLDDGTGTPSAGLIAQVYTAVDAYRAIAETFSVQPPVVVTATVSLILTLAPGYDRLVVGPQVAAVITAYINSLPLEVPLAAARIPALAFAASPGVLNATSILINGGNADLGGGSGNVVKAGTVSVS